MLTSIAMAWRSSSRPRILHMLALIVTLAMPGAACTPKSQTAKLASDGAKTCPDWAAGQPYEAGARVFFNGAGYIAVHANPGYDPTISTWFWDPEPCESIPADGGSQTNADPQSPKRTIQLASGTHVYFNPDDKRDQKFSADLLETTDGIMQVLLRFKLSCPDGRCDAWDRLGSFGIYSPEHNNRYLELLRFMTPYGMGGEWTLDVTNFLPLFQGKKDFRLFIDTWVGPGNSAAGNGWLVDLSLEFTSGSLAEQTALIVPILSFDDIAYGDPNRATKRGVDIVPLLDFKSAKIVSTITGHGQGNAENCAEFCPKIHTIAIGSQNFDQRIWRDDCETTTDQGQGGNAKSPRAGWCPGDIVRPWEQDVTEAVRTASQASYDVEGYENTCRPDSKECKGCVFDTSCEYDGGNHTDPKYIVTSYIIYKK